MTDEAYEKFKAEEDKLNRQYQEEKAREVELSNNVPVTEYNIQIELEAAVNAFMAEHDPNNTSNGCWKIDVESGLFRAYGVDVRRVGPHFAQSENYYDPRAKIDEFYIDEYFDLGEIYSQAADLGDYPSDYTEEEREEAIEYDRSIVASAKKDSVEAFERGIITGEIIGKRMYHIKWI